MLLKKNYSAMYVKGIIALTTAITPIIIKIRNKNRNTINCGTEVFLLKLPNK